MAKSVSDAFDAHVFEEETRPPDQHELRAVAVLREFFNEHSDRVFTSRQVEVLHEREFFHWVSNRAVRDLVDEGLVKAEWRKLEFGGSVKLHWHRANRYPRRALAELVALVEEYSAPNIGGALGLHGEHMVLEGFAREEFVMRGREAREYNGRANAPQDVD